MPDPTATRIAAAAAILRRYGATEVNVFGSAADGTMDEHSEVDLAARGIPPRSFFEAMGAAQQELDCPLDLIDLDQEDPFTRYLTTEQVLKRVA